MSRLLVLLLGFSGVAGQLSGCTTAATTNTPRTATEQLLISNAVDGALDKVSFAPFAGARVFIEEKYVDGVDSKYLIASVRHRVLQAGGKLVDKADNADVVVELRSGGIGTTTAKSYLGTPEIALPGMISIPELRLVERSRQSGTAKVGLVAYDASTKEVLGAGGVTLDRADDNNWFLAGIGPLQTGTVKDEIELNTKKGPWVPKEQTMPQQVAFERARPMPTPEQKDPQEVQYASYPKEAQAPAAFPAKK